MKTCNNGRHAEIATIFWKDKARGTNVSQSLIKRA